MTDLPDRIRIPRESLASWARVRARLRADLEAAPDLPHGRTVVTDALIAASMIALCEAALGLGPGIIGREGAPYEAPPRDPADEPTIINDLQARIERLERAAFWRNLEENPPKDGVPILPSPEWLEEAREKFPDLYGPEAGDD